MNAPPTSMNSERLETNAGNDKQSQLTLELLQAIEQKNDISQRHLAQQLGVALGLANSSLKRCVKKGWIKISTAPANRYLYYLTPTGFAEKARLTADFITTSLALFRQSGNEYSSIYTQCLNRSEKRILLAGMSDLTEIAIMRAMQCDIEIVGVYQPESTRNEFFGVPVLSKHIECASFNRIIMTSMEQTQHLIYELERRYDSEKIIIPAMLLNINYRNPAITESPDNVSVNRPTSDYLTK